MSELEILYGVFEAVKEKNIFDLEIAVDAFAEEHQAIKCRNTYFHNKNTGIVKINCDSKIDTKDIKCVHKIENETNLKAIGEKYNCLKGKTDKSGILSKFENVIDFSILLSLLNSMEVNQNEDESAIITINLQSVAKDLAEDDFECFNSEMNSLLLSVIKMILNDIKSDKYDTIVLSGYVDRFQEITKIEVIGNGRHKINATILSK